MRKQIVIMALAVLALASCKKEENMEPTTVSVEGEDKVTSVPLSFTQKVLMEMYSTVGCATCPDAELKYRQYATANPNKVYGVCVHTSDAMTNPQFNFMDGLLNITAYSSGSFNRLPYNGLSVLHKTTWNNSTVSTALNKTAKCGLKIVTTKSGTSASVTVYAGFKQTMTGNYNLTVYLMEDSVNGTGSGYNQANYYQNIASSPFYQMGNPIINYQHPFVLRKVVTPAIGLPIGSSYIKAGGQLTKSFTVNISGYDANQLYIVAFVNKVGTNTVTHEIMNVQRVKVGQTKNYD